MEDFYCSINFECYFCWVEYPRTEIILIQIPEFPIPYLSAFKDSVDKSAVILIGLPLYGICYFFFLL
jgi:hypothetical protein